MVAKPVARDRALLACAAMNIETSSERSTSLIGRARGRRRDVRRGGNAPNVSPDRARRTFHSFKFTEKGKSA